MNLIEFLRKNKQYFVTYTMVEDLLKPVEKRKSFLDPYMDIYQLEKVTECGSNLDDAMDTVLDAACVEFLSETSSLLDKFDDRTQAEGEAEEIFETTKQQILEHFKTGV